MLGRGHAGSAEWPYHPCWPLSSLPVLNPVRVPRRSSLTNSEVSQTGGVSQDTGCDRLHCLSQTHSDYRDNDTRLCRAGTNHCLEKSGVTSVRTALDLSCIQRWTEVRSGKQLVTKRAVSYWHGQINNSAIAASERQSYCRRRGIKVCKHGCSLFLLDNRMLIPWCAIHSFQLART
jgi:hypothetical protein